MTKINKSIIFLIIVSTLLILIIPSKIIQLLFYFVLFLIAFSFFYSHRLKKSITAEREVSKLKVACKEKFDISITVKNNSRLPASICYIFDEAPYLLIYGNNNSDIVKLRSGEIKKIRYTVSAPERGIYEVGPIKIQSSDPLKIFKFEIEIPCILPVTVRPARINLITNAYPGLPQGNIKINNPIYEDISQRRTIRNYINGDELRRINWRICAKQNKLFTNVYENTFDTSFFIFLNLAEDDYELHSRFFDTEKAIQIAASIVEKARKLKQRVGFAAYGTDFPYIKPGQNQYDSILDILSVIKLEKGKLEYDPYKLYKSQLPNGTIFFTIGPEEVKNYFTKVEASLEEITSENIGVYRKDNVGA